MRKLTHICSLALLGAAFWLPTLANGQGAIGNCDPAIAEQYLDVNNVSARIPNNGELFYRNEPHWYNVPKGSPSMAIFASGIWLGGMKGNDLHIAATRYSDFEFWAGPLEDNGDAPADCAQYDRSYKVSRADIVAYEAGGAATPDLQDWPTGLGAPTLDANGDPIDLLDQSLNSRKDRVIDLDAGERPDLFGDMMVWWVMNDMGNQHESTDGSPIGVEVHATAFAFDVAGDIGNATFYRYRIYYKGTIPLTEAYMGIYSDPDLGDAGDDYVGSDTTLGLAYVYNADNNDVGGEGYGANPPAIGYDFFQGPIVPSPGDSAQVSGVKIPDYKNLKMTSFVFYVNSTFNNGEPIVGTDYYRYMKGVWRDGSPIYVGGNGYQGAGVTTEETTIMFPGDPVTKSYWSEFNYDNQGNFFAPSDRRFVLASGPFTIEPGDVQEIIFGLPYGRGSDHLDSITAMRDADALAQAAFDVNFKLPQAPARPIVKFTELDRKVVLEWSNSPASNNFLESYEEIDPFAPLTDPDYLFEGYKIYRFTGEADLTGVVIQTFDVPNGVTEVIDGFPGKPTAIVATGTDSGVQTYATIDGLTNYQTYHFGVQAYAYNEGSYPKIFPSPIVRIVATPRRSEDVISQDAIDRSESFGESDITINKVGSGDGVVSVDIVNPAVIPDDTDYSVVFRAMELAGKTSSVVEVSDEPDAKQPDRAAAAAKSTTDTGITYDIFRGSDLVFDGNINGSVAPQREKVVVIDGLQFSVTGPPPGMNGFEMVANAGGPLDPPDMAAFAFNSSGFPTVDGKDRPEGGYNQSTNGSTWGVNVGGGDGDYGDEAGPFNQGSTWVGRSIRELPGWSNVGADNYEWRFTQACVDGIDGVMAETDCLAWRPFDDGEWWMEVPFTLWNVGPTSDPNDDYQMVPGVCESGCGAGAEDYVFDIAGDHDISGGSDDPYTDWVYWYKPEDNGATPGSQGYFDFFFGTADVGQRVFSRQVLVNWNGGVDPGPYDADLPEPGTVVRYVTKKPNADGDTFSFNTTGYGVQTASTALKSEKVAEIGISPNPYKGASIYEKSQLIDEVRFTNLLSEATTVRIFTLNGSLIREMFKPQGVRNLTWNLTTDNNLPIASGLYLIHVEVDGLGETVIKFAVVRKATQLDTY